MAAQRRAEKLIATFLIVVAITTSITLFFDQSDDLLTTWDQYGGPITSVFYLASGLMILYRPTWLLYALLLTVIPTFIYEQGVLFWAVHFPTEASYYSAAGSGPFFPLIYLVLFITLPRGAARWSWINCAGFYLQFVINNTLLGAATPHAGRTVAEHVLMGIMMAHPLYIIGLTYIVHLRERLTATQRQMYRDKEDFLGMLSHEVKNLLQTMMVAIDQLDVKLRNRFEHRSVSRLQVAATQLNTYLSDVAELTKLENPSYAVQRQPVRLPDLLRDLGDEWRPEAEKKGLFLQAETEPETLTCTTDETRLRQIASNLISNALKYSDAGGVTLSARPHPVRHGFIELAVADTGIGIETAMLEKIFLPYVRLEKAGRRRSAGSGLGLTIVQRLVESIGGSIVVESRVGEGTRFSVSIPSDSITQAV